MGGVITKPQFAFTHDGRIQALPENNNAAKQIIGKLGLDIPKLNALRRKAIKPFLDKNLNATDVDNFASGYLKKMPRENLESSGPQ